MLLIKNPPANAGDIRDVDLITGSGSYPGGGHGNSFLYCLENLNGQRSLWATVHGVTIESDSVESLSKELEMCTTKNYSYFLVDIQVFL